MREADKQWRKRNRHKNLELHFDFYIIISLQKSQSFLLISPIRIEMFHSRHQWSSYTLYLENAAHCIQASMSHLPRTTACLHVKRSTCLQGDQLAEVCACVCAWEGGDTCMWAACTTCIYAVHIELTMQSEAGCRRQDSSHSQAVD